MGQDPPFAMATTFTHGSSIMDPSLHGLFRMHYMAEPDLYSVHSPGTAAPRLASTSGAPHIAITTPGPAHLVPITASSGNVVDLAREKGGTRKPKGRPVISCDRCHRRKRKCHSSEGSESCDFCTQMRINGDTEACTWDLMRKYSDQT
jgi:hypothetical protein